METSFRRTKPVPAAPAVALSTASTPVAGTLSKNRAFHQEFHQPEWKAQDQSISLTGKLTFVCQPGCLVRRQLVDFLQCRHFYRQRIASYQCFFSGNLDL
jgi:hypothetical protein